MRHANVFIGRSCEANQWWLVAVKKVGTGIVLAKNYPAKALGIKTGEVLWQVRRRYSDMVVVPPDFRKYLRFSRPARAIYENYTDQIESFGIDECWLDVTGAIHLFGSGEEIADAIRKRFKGEMGISGSCGVSWNKIFSKLASDYRKPDVTTVITQDNYKDIVWSLPVGDLLYVGKAIENKLRSKTVFTIGDLAHRDVHSLKLLLGVWGETLWCFANGLDDAPVKKLGEETFIKSVGNSTTTKRDLVNNQDVKLIIYVLAESIATRLRSRF